MKKTLATLLGLGLLCASSQALAEDGYKTQTDDNGYTVEFGNDFLDGNDLDSSGPILRVRPMGARVVLIRPRTSFVTELKKTVESL